MKTRLLAFAAIAALIAGAAHAQAADPNFKPPRTAWGAPDLSGNWTNVSITPEQRPASLGTKSAYTKDEAAKMEATIVKEIADGNERSDPNAGAPTAGGDKPKPGTRPEWLDPGSHVMYVNGEPRTSILTTADGRVPKPKAGVSMPSPFGRGGGLGSFDNPENRSLGERCIIGFGRNAGPPMLANGFYNNNYQFVQTKDDLAIVVEMVHDVRHVKIGGEHRTDGQRPYMGDSIGRWDGDTLVVETTNIPQSQAYYGAWKTLKVTERFTRTGKYKLRYAFSVEDPSVWDKPWGGEYEFNPLDGAIYEYACHEGNHALPGMLGGERYLEKQKRGAE